MSRTLPQKYAPMSITDNDSEEFIATATPVGALSTTDNCVLEVIAPATLPQGYTFEVEAYGKTVKVTVPTGGVEEGEKFSVPFEPSSNVDSESLVPRSSVPVGHWKDDLCNCCEHGCFHPVLWNASCCPLIILGQVMHRLKLTWSANEGGSAAQTESTFHILFWMGISFGILRYFNAFLPLFFTDEKGQLTDAYYIAHFVVGKVLLVYVVLWISLLAKTRRHIRNKYNIPSQQCNGCEDFCCAFWCNCCTVAQMARHTGDYETYQGMCCSETGLPSDAPSIV